MCELSFITACFFFRNELPALNLNILVRDWANKMQYNFGHHDKSSPSDPNKNLYQKYFSLQNNNANARIRASILNDFTTVSIDTLPYPGQNLANQVDASPSAGDPVFLQFLKSYIQTHFSPAAIKTNRKRLGGAFATGLEMSELVSRWANYFKSASLPPAKSIFMASAELQHTSAVTDLANQYDRELTVLLASHPDGLANIDDHVLGIRSKIETQFVNLNLLGKTEFHQEYTNILQKKIQSLGKNHIATNNSKLQAAEHRREQERIRLQQVQEQERLRQEEEKRAQ
jgi:hypothetical protein